MTNHPNRAKTERAVLVTTVHKGVFFGYATKTDGATIKLRAARNCIYWPVENKGFLGLASTGPVILLGGFGIRASRSGSGCARSLYFGAATMTVKTDKSADAAMRKLWRKWFEFYRDHFRGSDIAISAADQMAFYEIAQPIMRGLADPSETAPNPSK